MAAGLSGVGLAGGAASLLSPRPGSGWDRLAARNRPQWHNREDSVIPKMFRQYAKRYGAGVAALKQAQLQYPVEYLDNGRDRARRRNAGG